jgi:hypothetical protein
MDRNLTSAARRACGVCRDAVRSFALVVSVAMLVLVPARGWAGPIQVSGNLAFYPGTLGRFTAADISSATNADVLSEYQLLNGLTGIELRGPYALASVDEDGLNIFDLSVWPPERVEGGRFGTPGAALDVALNGSYAFIADGTNGIAVADVFDVTAPGGLPPIIVSGDVSSVVARSNQLYAACGSAGLRLYDVTNPAAVNLRGQRLTAQPARQVTVSGAYAFVCCDGGLLEIISVQNPAAPALTGSYAAGGPLAAVAVSGNIALLARTNGTLVTLNVSNPGAPVALGTNQVTGGAVGVVIVGERAFVLTATEALVVVALPQLPATGPVVLEPVAPVTGVIGQSFVVSVRAVGTTPLGFQWRHNGVPLTDGGRFQGVTNAWLNVSNAVAADAGVYAVSISNAFGQVTSSNVVTLVNAGMPLFRGDFTPGGIVEDVDLDSERAFIAAGTFGLEVYDVANPRHPKRAGGNDVAGYVSTVRVQNGDAYVGLGENGLQIFHTAGGIVSELTAATNTSGTAGGVYLEAGLVYLADGTNGLQVFALTETLQPSYVGGYDTPGFARDVFVLNGLAYVADGTNGVQILSVTNPAVITFLGGFDTVGDLRRVQVRDTVAYLAADDEGLLMLDVTLPQAPSLLASVPNTAPALDVEVVDGRAIVARGTNGLTVLDIENPLAVLEVGSDSTTTAQAVRAEGNFLYVATGAATLKIYELAGLDPDNPEILAAPADVVALVGEARVLNVTATGLAPLNYQWFKDGVPLRNGPFISGVNTATLSLSQLQNTNSGVYAVEIRNGWNLAETVQANLHVVPLGTPVLISGYTNQGDALNLHVVGETVFVASRLYGLQAISWRDPFNPALLDQEPTLDLAQDVFVAGRYAYVASWTAGLEIFDVLNPTNLVRVGHCDTAGLARQVRVQGSRAYVADRGGGVAIIDVSQPTRPQLIGRSAAGGIAEGLATSGNHTFVAAADSGLQILDTANPLAPPVIAQLDTPGHAEGVTLVSNRIYLADHNRGMQIVEVNNPAAPVSLGSLQTAGDVFDVHVADSRAYLAEGITLATLVDVSNPAAAAQLGTSLGGTSVHGLQVVGNHVFYADRVSGLLVAELYGVPPPAPIINAVTQNGSDVAGQELVLSVSGEGLPPLNYAWYRNGILVTNSPNLSGADQSGLRFAAVSAADAGSYVAVVSSGQGSVTSSVISVTAPLPGTPLAQGGFDTPGAAAVAVAHGHVAYVADGPNVLRVVNLSDPAAPTLLGTFAPTGTVTGLCIQSNRLYLALGTNGVTILEITDLEQPKFLGAFSPPGPALNLTVTNGVAYVAAGPAGLRLYNVTNSAAVFPLGFVDTDGSATDVSLAGNFAYLADGAGGVKIINVANPAAPVSVGSYPTGSEARALMVRGANLFVAAAANGLRALDVSNPAAPSLLGTYPTPAALDVNLVGDFVVLVDANLGCLVLNVTNPATMSLVGGLTNQPFTDVGVAGNLLLLPAGASGLRLATAAGVTPPSARFVTQPVAQSVLAGGTAQFMSWPEGGGAPELWRWYHDDRPLFDDGRIRGAATAQLTVSNVGFADMGSYQLRAYGPGGVTNSLPATLTFIGPLQAQINAAAPGAEIALSPGTYTEMLVVDRDLTFTGPWWDKPILSGGHAGPALRVLPGVNVRAEGVAFRNGYNTGDGGAVRNEGALTLDHCLVADSAAANGGGIANFGVLTLLQSVVSNNAAGNSGGGLLNSAGALAWVTNTTLIGNQANYGAGVANAGTNSIAQSLLAYNWATGTGATGGGLRSIGGLVNLINVTVSGNEASSVTGNAGTGAGGGIEVAGGRVELEFATVAANAASVRGGGIAVTAGELWAHDSIFSGNSAPSSPDFQGALSSAGHNLLERVTGVSVLGATSGNLLGVDPRLGPLADNGGPTWTHAPADDSPVLDAGSVSGPPTDARGLSRPFDLLWRPEVAGAFDLGAIEVLDQTPYLLVSNRVAAGFTLLWKTNAVLQRSSTSAGAWLDQTNTSPLFVNVMTNGLGFFRLRRELPPAVLTSNNHTGLGFDLAWPDFGILERGPTPDGPWEAVTGQGPYHVEMIPVPAEFFRVRLIAR